jgi:Domain of unknown function (DUF5076)
MESLPRQLPIPPHAATDSKAIEILRVWAAAGQQHVSIDAGLWKDPGNWGVMLVDLARHIADAYKQSGKIEYLAALDRIRKGFDAEWDCPTDQPRGTFLR